MKSFRHGPAADDHRWSTAADNDVELIPFDEVQVRAAVIAEGRCGKGIDAKATQSFRLWACAPAIPIGAPLLFEADDFSHTNVQRYLPAWRRIGPSWPGLRPLAPRQRDSRSILR